MSINSTVKDVTDRIAARSELTREAYLDRIEQHEMPGRESRHALSCGNLAHGFAACAPADKAKLAGDSALNLGIVTSYNDMLSAHQPYRRLSRHHQGGGPRNRRHGAGCRRRAGHVRWRHPGPAGHGPVALFARRHRHGDRRSRFSHNMFDAAVYLGICDKIVPGLLIGALTFGHLPAVFVPAGPMPSGLPNDEKAKVRQLYMEGKVGRAELLEAEAKSYHSPGTCTFYGTANSNQMLMEIMGLHLPGASFVNPGTPAARCADPRGGQARAVADRRGQRLYPHRPHHRREGHRQRPRRPARHRRLDQPHLHLVAIASAAGLQVTWDDMSDLSDAVPLLARVYPNGIADVNHFHAAGGMGFLIRELLDAGYLHEDVKTVWGNGLSRLHGRGEADRGQAQLRAGAQANRQAQGAGAGRRRPSPEPAGSSC